MCGENEWKYGMSVWVECLLVKARRYRHEDTPPLYAWPCSLWMGGWCESIGRVLEFVWHSIRGVVGGLP